MNDNDNHLQMGGEDVAFATSSPPNRAIALKSEMRDPVKILEFQYK